MCHAYSYSNRLPPPPPLYTATVSELRRDTKGVDQSGISHQETAAAAAVLQHPQMCSHAANEPSAMLFYTIPFE